MNILPNSYDSFTLLTVIIASSFFGSFAKELNDTAKKPQSFLMFLSEILLNGVSGTVIGIGVAKFICTDLLIIIASSITSGIMGMTLLKFALKVMVLVLGKVKEIDVGNLEDIDKELNEDNNDKD